MSLVIIREIVKIFAPSVLIYGFILALSMVVFPPKRLQRLDTNEASVSFLFSPPAYIVYRSTLFSSNKPAIVLIGPSNVQEGFNASIVSQNLGGADVHVASIGGASIDDMAAIVSLIYANRPPQNRGTTTFVLGLWYGEFLHNESSKERTFITQQMERFGLFKKIGDGYKRSVSSPIFDMSVNLLRPFFLLNGSLQRNGILVQAWEKYRGITPPPPSAKPLECDKATRQRLSKKSKANTGSIGKNQFESLANLSELIARKGGRLVLVDLPITRCLEQTTPFWKDYQDLKIDYISSAVTNGAVYLNFQDMDNNQNFKDAVHMLPNAANLASKRLARELGRISISRK